MIVNKFTLWFYDVLAWIVRIDTWQNLRAESRAVIEQVRDLRDHH